MLDSQVQKTMASNLKVIESLFKVAILWGLAMRGHRRSQEVTLGNFVQLVRFRAETDKDLANHLSKCPRNARYTSKTILYYSFEVLNNILTGVKDGSASYLCDCDE